MPEVIHNSNFAFTISPDLSIILPFSYTLYKTLNFILSPGLYNAFVEMFFVGERRIGIE